MNNSKYLGIAMIIFQSIIYGIPDCFVKIVYQEFPVMSFLGTRYFLASTFMLCVWGKSIITELKAAKISNYILPVLCMGSAFLISNSALKYAPVSNAGFIRSSTPLIVAVMLMVLYNRRFTLKDAITIGIMLLGMYFLANQRGQGVLQGFGLGEVLSFIAACTIAGSIVFGKDALKHISPITLTCMQCIASFIFCIIVSFLDGSLQATNWNLMAQPHIYIWMLYLALACSVGGLLLQNYALNHINSKMASVLQCLYPIIASITAYFVIDETMTLVGILGCTLVITSVVIECSNAK